MPVDLDDHSRSPSASDDWVRVERDALGEGPDGHGEESVEDDVKIETPDIEQLGRDVSGSGSRDDSPSSTST